MSMPTKTREDIRRDEELEYLAKTVKLLKDKIAAMHNVMEDLYRSAVTIAFDDTCDQKTARKVAQHIAHVLSGQSYNLGMMCAELNSVKCGLTRIRSTNFSSQ